VQLVRIELALLLVVHRLLLHDFVHPQQQPRRRGHRSDSDVLLQKLIAREVILKVVDREFILISLELSQLLMHDDANVLEPLQQGCVLILQGVVPKLLSNLARHSISPLTDLVIDQLDVLPPLLQARAVDMQEL
jgi:hypothetical protein